MAARPDMFIRTPYRHRISSSAISSTATFVKPRTPLEESHRRPFVVRGDEKR